MTVRDDRASLTGDDRGRDGRQVTDYIVRAAGKCNLVACSARHAQCRSPDASLTPGRGEATPRSRPRRPGPSLAHPGREPDALPGRRSVAVHPGGGAAGHATDLACRRSGSAAATAPPADPLAAMVRKGVDGTLLIRYRAQSITRPRATMPRGTFGPGAPRNRPSHIGGGEEHMDLTRSASGGPYGRWRNVLSACGGSRPRRPRLQPPRRRPRRPPRPPRRPQPRRPRPSQLLPAAPSSASRSRTATRS